LDFIPIHCGDKKPLFEHTIYIPKKGGVVMSRGVGFNHKRKGHPGDFPKHTLVEKHTTEAQEEEELLVTQEAFKNRIKTEE